jgi:hypothetical protein
MNRVVDRFCGFVDLLSQVVGFFETFLLNSSIPCSYGTGLYVYPVLWHNWRVHKRTSRPRKNKATEWAIGQPLSFPLKGKISEPAKRPKSKPLDNKRTAES